MQTPVVHVGYHKTATSALQKYIFESGENDICVPWDYYSGKALTHFVHTHPLKFDPDKVRQEFESLYLQKMKNDRSIPLISHEDLSAYPVQGKYYGFEVADRIKKTFPKARILITIREQRSMIKSLYKWYVRIGGEWKIDQFIGTGKETLPIVPLLKLDHLEYDLFIKKYIDLYSKDSILVLPIELLIKDRAEYFKLLQNFIGVKVNYDNFNAANVNYGAYTMNLYRRLNRLLKRPPLYNYRSEKRSFNEVFKNRICKINDKLIPASFDRRVEKKLNAFINKRVKDHYRISNNNLSEIIGMDLNNLGYE